MKKLLAVGMILAAAPAFAAELSYAPSYESNSNGVSDLRSSPVTLTQSLSQAIVSGNSVACNAGGLSTDNSYYRSFNLNTLAFPLQVTSVSFGIEAVIGTPLPLTVRLWRDTNGGAPDLGMVLVGSSAAFAVNAGMDGTIQNVAVNGLFNVGDIMVVEVFSPDSQAAGGGFFIGSNDAGQTGASYIAAAACGLPNPASLASIGFPNMHIVMNVHGKLVPTPGAAAVLGLAGLAGLRRRR